MVVTLETWQREHVDCPRARLRNLHAARAYRGREVELLEAENEFEREWMDGWRAAHEIPQALAMGLAIVIGTITLIVFAAIRWN